MDKLIETDRRGRATLTGHADQRFLMQENEDGTVLLIPAIVMSQAQYEYDTNPELRNMLDEAMRSPRVSRTRPKRRTE